MRSFVVALVLASVIGCALVDGTALMSGFSFGAGVGRTDLSSSIQLAWDPQETRIDQQSPCVWRNELLKLPRFRGRCGA